MKKFSIADLARIIKATVETVTENEHQVSSIEHRVSSHDFFTGVSIDTRTIKPGECFFAIPGENFDGHDYVCDAFARGAACAVVSRDIYSKFQIRNSKSEILKEEGKCLLKVADTITALGDFAREYRRQAGFKVVAITGSVGKTTTRHIAYHVLSRHFCVFQSPKNFNNNIGLPLTLLGADPEHQIVIAELGTNHPGEIVYLTGIALPDVAVVTNVHPAHLEGFGSTQAIAREKLSIAEGLQPDGVLIINGDLLPLLSASGSQTPNKIVTFGKKKAWSVERGANRKKLDAKRYPLNADFQAGNIRFDERGSRFIIGGTEIRLPLPGPGNVENALAAWAICAQFGPTIDDFAQAVSAEGGLAPVSMRTELLQIGTLTVINDCYNANPASMKNALQILSSLGSTRKGRLVFICGDMAELGEQTEQLHAELGESIARTRVQLLLAVGKFAKIAAEAAKPPKTSWRTDAIRHELQIECFEDTASACNNLQKFVKDSDIILVKGSRTAGLEAAVEKLKELFGKRK
jgi:UDP-N-acetylmuramoyl-tripeptide--D-alanyl-D-alanine ligase